MRKTSSKVTPIDTLRFSKDRFPVWCDHCHGEGFILPSAINRRYKSRVPIPVVFRYAEACHCGNWPEFGEMQRFFLLSA